MQSRSASELRGRQLPMHFEADEIGLSAAGERVEAAEVVLAGGEENVGARRNRRC